MSAGVVYHLCFWRCVDVYLLFHVGDVRYYFLDVRWMVTFEYLGVSVQVVPVFIFYYTDKK